MSNNSKISIQERTKKFAVRIVKAYVEINKNNHFNDAAAVLSKQFLRSGTSVGANCAEGKCTQSIKDLISKYSIALKENFELIFWIEVMIEAEIVPAQKFALLLKEANEIASILTASIKTLKTKNF